MLEAFSKAQRIRTFILFAFCAAILIVAAVIGIGDNPPGLVLTYLSSIFFILAFVHPWRTPKKFLYLIYTSVAGLIVFGVLHNVFEMLGDKAEGCKPAACAIAYVGVGVFLLAVFLCPAGLLVGMVGAIAASRRKGGSQPGSPAA